MPPETMPLWQKDYFELKVIEKMGEKLSAAPIGLKGQKFVKVSPPL